jgi:hypothetical protein
MVDLRVVEAIWTGAALAGLLVIGMIAWREENTDGRRCRTRRRRIVARECGWTVSGIAYRAAIVRSFGAAQL